MVGTGNNHTQIRRVLVIDDDAVARALIANHCQSMGITDLVHCEDGEAGWQALQTQQFDLIVLDWKLPKLSGLGLFNRIRQHHGSRFTPVLVVSGLLVDSDFRLLQEFPATSLMQKPFTAGRFQLGVETLANEAAWYHRNAELVDSALAAAKHDGKRAEQLVRQVIKTSPNPIPVAVLAARQLINQNLLSQAQSILESVLKLDEQSVMAMNELGKVLHLQGQHRQALDRLRLAHKLSPQNLERLCLLGEVGLNLLDPDEARAHFEKALLIDPEDVKANSGLIVADNMDDLFAQDPRYVPRSFASILNTIGISLVRTSKFAQGIAQYQSALVFLRSGNDAARIAFNLGLGYLRWGKPSAALTWFQKSERMVPGGFDKSAAYIRRLLAQGGGGAKNDKLSVSALPMPLAASALSERANGDLNGEASGGGQVIPFPVQGFANSASGEPDFEEAEDHVGRIVL